MGELVQDGVNGLTFKHRDASSLAEAILIAIEQPRGMQFLGQGRYPQSEAGDVRCVKKHVQEIMSLYARLLESQIAEGQASSNAVLGKPISILPPCPVISEQDGGATATPPPI
jgi:hypothetical protein